MYVAAFKKKSKPRASLSAHAKMQSKSLQDCRESGSNRYCDRESDNDCQPVIINESLFTPIANSHSLNLKMVPECEDEDTEAAVIADDFREMNVSGVRRAHCKPHRPFVKCIPTTPNAPWNLPLISISDDTKLLVV